MYKKCIELESLFLTSIVIVKKKQKKSKSHLTIFDSCAATKSYIYNDHKNCCYKYEIILIPIP